MKIALAMIVKPTDEEAVVLSRCLDNVAQFVDGVFITLAGTDPKNEACEAVCAIHNATISRFTWINDFSAARNYNFSQVPKEYDYILWCDADDVFRGLDKLRGVMENNVSDTYSFNYLYAFDEHNNPVVVHLKTQVVKNDGCVEWVGKLHEDFKANRQISGHFVKEVERLHLSTDDRFNTAKERNLDVAMGQLNDYPDDPRSYWNVGNSLVAMGRWEEAINMFDGFMFRSESEEEKYLARLRRAESYWAMGKLEEALNECRYAIGIRPEYPDAYHQSGRLLFLQKQYKRASEMFLIGLKKKPPYYSIIVYNPRDYDYNPMLDLSKCFLKMERPDNALMFLKACYEIIPSDYLNNIIKETECELDRFNRFLKVINKLSKISDPVKFRKAYDKLDPDIKSYPPVVVLRNKLITKVDSSGKDLVYYCGYTSRQWDGNTTNIGGSEEAVINLTRLFKKDGWNVVVYNNCGHKEVNCDGVIYRPFWEFNYRDKNDVVILWRSPIVADFDVNCGKLLVDLHDVISPGEFTESRLKRIDKVFVKSNFHKDLFPNIPNDKFVVVPNGIWPDKLIPSKDKDDKLIINTSSPDRSLSAFCRVARAVKKIIPDAKFKWAYGWGVFDTVHSDSAIKMEWKNSLIKECEEVGVEMLGMISHDEIADITSKANIFLYPTEFAEIDCISLTKTMCCETYPITTDFGALGEKKDHGGMFVHSEKTKDNWCGNYQHDFSLSDDEKISIIINETIEKIKNPRYEDRKEMSNFAISEYSWDKIAKIWIRELKQKNL